jgi:hypothetical protein
MVKRAFGRKYILSSLVVVIVALVSWTPATASPFGQGVFGADVPFGSGTSMAIALGGDVALTLSGNGSNFSGTGSHTLTVTSTDAAGYMLYAYSPGSTTMTSGSDTIPASSNGTAAPLAMNTWGYNTDGSSNFMGMTTTPALIKNTSGPFKNGDPTTVTYGVLTNVTKAAGTYTVPVIYTAVAKNE